LHTSEEGAESIYIKFNYKNRGALYPHATNIHQNTAPPCSSYFPQVRQQDWGGLGYMNFCILVNIFFQ